MRLLLNIFNNAFYAVNDRKKKEVNGYDPKVSVSTSGDGEKVVITIRDNGTGIPEKIRDKIFQSFFTTKPTGQGTDLGLSLIYNIVKAHGGGIGVHSEPGKGTSFVIHLPFQ